MLKFDSSTLWRISAWERMKAEAAETAPSAMQRKTVLSTTMAAELSHLQRARLEGDVLEVLAACIRQRESALILLQHRGYVWPVTVFPYRELYHMKRSIVESLREGNADLQVLAVEPPGLRPPGHEMHERIDEVAAYRPLRELLWTMAMYAPRAHLLEDIAGRAAYRLSAEYVPEAQTLAGALGPTLRRLRNEIAPLVEIARWPGMDRERAARLLNAIYLQGGLMVLRTHRAARDSESAGGRLRAWIRKGP